MPACNRPRNSTPAVPPATRKTFIDNLRVALTALVVAHHASLAFGSLGIWPNWQEPDDVASAVALDLFVLLNQSYFMGLFFLLSGLFVPRSADRRGPVGFARERLMRLGIPLAVALVTVRPLYALPNYLKLPATERGPYWLFFFGDNDIGPLWFLGVLLTFSLAYAFLRHNRSAVRSHPDETSQTAPQAWQIVVFALAMGGALYVWRLAVPVGTNLLGIPSASHLPQYALLFAVGIAAYRRNWISTVPRRAGFLGGGLILASLVPMVGLGGYETLSYAHKLPTTVLPHLWFGLWESMFGTGMILLLISVFRTHVTGDGPLARFLAANAFTVYLLHAPVIVGYVALFAPLGLPPVTSFAVILPLAVITSLLLAAAIRRIPGIRTVL